MIIRILSRLALLLLTSCLVHIQSAGAVKIVRLQLEYGGAGIATGGFAFSKITPTLDLELFDGAAPATVANYLSYVNGDFYNLTFINRSSSGVVLQTGGVLNSLADPDNDPLAPSGFIEVVELSPFLVNEPGLSNVRGTIAMAKMQDQPDSATNEWFINLDNNSNPLDVENGGSTVFGRLIDDGIDIADEIAQFPTTNLTFIFGSNPLAGSFLNLPLADYNPTGGETIFQRNLIMILTATEITRPVLRFSPEGGDFGFHDPADASGVAINILLTNTGNEILDVTSLNIGGLSAPFTLDSENCSGATINLISSCQITLLFTPSTAGVFEDSFTVDYIDQATLEAFSKTYHLSGEGASSPPDIDVTQALDIGVSEADGAPIAKDLIVRNTGQAGLKITSISGLNSAEFSQTSDCLSTGLSITTEDFCTITVNFIAANVGLKADSLIIESNDPLNSTVNITITGTGDTDSDGVISAVEMLAPNQGDGNNDEIDDSVQNNVVSLVDSQSVYVTFVSDDAINAKNINFESATAFGNVFLLTDDVPSGAPASLTLDDGLYHFEINFPDNGLLGDGVIVAMFLPLDVTAKRYYRFGPTLENTVSHWYDFSFDSETQTGATVLGEVELVSPSGRSVKKNMVLVNFVDGQRGDDDLLANGKIVHGIGGVDTKKSSSSSSSSGYAIYLWLFSLCFAFRKYSN